MPLHGMWVSRRVASIGPFALALPSPEGWHLIERSSVAQVHRDIDYVPWVLVADPAAVTPLGSSWRESPVDILGRPELGELIDDVSGAIRLAAPGDFLELRLAGRYLHDGATFARQPSMFREEIAEREWERPYRLDPKTASRAESAYQLLRDHRALARPGYRCVAVDSLSLAGCPFFDDATTASCLFQGLEALFGPLGRRGAGTGFELIETVVRSADLGATPGPRGFVNKSLVRTRNALAHGERPALSHGFLASLEDVLRVCILSYLSTTQSTRDIDPDVYVEQVRAVAGGRAAASIAPRA